MAPIFRISSTWVIILVHFVCVSLLVDLVHRLLHKVIKSKPQPLLKGLYYSGAFAVVITAAIIGYGYFNMQQIIHTQYRVHTGKTLKAAGYNIALISDLHFGTTMDANKLKEQAAEVEALKPDMVILDGDIVDESTSEEAMKSTFSILGKISSKYGTYFVYGNHDRAPYTNKPNFTAEQLKNVLQQSGIQVLEDSNQVVNDEIVLIGRADRGDGSSGKRATAEELTKNIDKSKVLLMLDHQPCEYEEARKAGVDLIMSGHTHGGQIWPGGIFSDIFHLNPLNYGIEKIGRLNAIVTSGMAGWGNPLRTEGHSEIVFIDLVY